MAYPTVSRDSNIPLIDFVESYLVGQGIASVRVPNEDGAKEALYAHVGPEIEGGVVLSGHTDVVPVDGQDWTYDPFIVTERDGKLFGRGSCDMKGFDALALAAMAKAARLHKEGRLKRPLQIALSYDEEIGCTGAPTARTWRRAAESLWRSCMSSQSSGSQRWRRSARGPRHWLPSPRAAPSSLGARTPNV